MKVDWTDHPCFEEEGRDGGRSASSSSSTSTTKYWDSGWESNEEGEREKIGGEPRNRFTRGSRKKQWFKPFQKIRLLLTIMWICCQFVPVAEGQAIGTLITVGERRTTEFSVDNMNGLFNTLSNAPTSWTFVDNTGNSIMPNGATAVLAVGVYECSGGTCAGDTMLATEGLNGILKCLEDNASCILNGEQTRGGMYVWGTGASTLFLRALTFKDGETTGSGGGVYIRDGAIVTIELCVFSNCRSTSSSSGGGAIYLQISGTTVNVYGTSFNDNTAASGNGDDIYRSSGTITIHNMCPSPYSSNTPIQGKLK